MMSFCSERIFFWNNIELVSTILSPTTASNAAKPLNLNSSIGFGFAVLEDPTSFVFLSLLALLAFTFSRAVSTKSSSSWIALANSFPAISSYNVSIFSSYPFILFLYSATFRCFGFDVSDTAMLILSWVALIDSLTLFIASFFASITPSTAVTRASIRSLMSWEAFSEILFNTSSKASCPPNLTMSFSKSSLVLPSLFKTAILNPLDSTPL